jgi:small subunit ribosomal protein S3
MIAYCVSAIQPAADTEYVIRNTRRSKATMGHKINPTGFRIGVIYDWQAKWYSDRNYAELLHEDIRIRQLIQRTLGDAGISKIDIERNANQVSVTIHTAKPGIVIGRGGQKVEELRNRLERLASEGDGPAKRVRVNIQEIRTPELDAYLVARSIADQLQRRVAFRRAMKQAVQRTMQRGAKGIKVMVAGRLGGAEMSRRETEMDGRVPLHTLRAEIDYGFAEAHTTFGRIGVKVWIYKGEILPEPKRRPEVERPEAAAAAAPVPAEAEISPLAAAAVAALDRPAEPVPAPPRQPERPAAVAVEPVPEPEPAPVPIEPESVPPTPAPAAAAEPPRLPDFTPPIADYRPS